MTIVFRKCMKNKNNLFDIIDDQLQIDCIIFVSWSVLLRVCGCVLCFFFFQCLFKAFWGRIGYTSAWGGGDVRKIINLSHDLSYPPLFLVHHYKCLRRTSSPASLARMVFRDSTQSIRGNILTRHYRIRNVALSLVLNI